MDGRRLIYPHYEFNTGKRQRNTRCCSYYFAQIVLIIEQITRKTTISTLRNLIGRQCSRADLFDLRLHQCTQHEYALGNSYGCRQHIFARLTSRNSRIRADSCIWTMTKLDAIRHQNSEQADPDR